MEDRAKSSKSSNTLMFFCVELRLGLMLSLYFVISVFSVMNEISPALSIFGEILFIFSHKFVVIFLLMLFSFRKNLN